MCGHGKQRLLLVSINGGQSGRRAGIGLVEATSVLPTGNHSPRRLLTGRGRGMTNFILGAVIGATVVFIPMAVLITRLINEWRDSVIEAKEYAEHVNEFLTRLRDNI